MLTRRYTDLKSEAVRLGQGGQCKPLHRLPIRTTDGRHMSYAHADPNPIAEAEILPLDAEEDNEVRSERLLQLFLDTDGVFRWYEEDEASEISSETLHEALQQAESEWDGFQLVEYRGEPVTPGQKMSDVYAADLLEDLEQQD